MYTKIFAEEQAPEGLSGLPSGVKLLVLRLMCWNLPAGWAETVWFHQQHYPYRHSLPTYAWVYEVAWGIETMKKQTVLHSG